MNHRPILMLHYFIEVSSGSASGIISFPKPSKIMRQTSLNLQTVKGAGKQMISCRTFHRTFVFRHSLTWARKLLARYTQNETRTNRSECPMQRFTIQRITVSGLLFSEELSSFGGIQDG
jgi:hypothetical protein